MPTNPMTTDRAREVLETQRDAIASSLDKCHPSRDMAVWKEIQEALTLALASMEREDAMAKEYSALQIQHDKMFDMAVKYRTALNNLHPGLVFDLRMAMESGDDGQDIDALRSRVRTIEEALNPAGGEEVGDGLR